MLAELLIEEVEQMTHQQSVIIASVLSGRVDVLNLTYEQRNLMGIRIDPNSSDGARNEALQMIERCLIKHLEKRTEFE